jgi:hypothetical protein
MSMALNLLTRLKEPANLHQQALGDKWQPSKAGVATQA